MIVDKIMAYLESEGKSLDSAILEEAAVRFKDCLTRQFMRDAEERKFRVSPSNAGKCPRQLHLIAHGAEKEPINARTKMTFWFGDILEVGVYALAQLAGCDIGEAQAEIQTICGRGFIDGLVQVDGAYYVFEAKSMSDFSFKRFASDDGPYDDDTWGYVTQSRIYSKALDAAGTVLVAVNKNTGHMHERIVERNDMYIQMGVDLAQMAVEAVEGCIDRPFWATESLKHMPKAKCWELTDARCTYCPVKKSCWPHLYVETLKGGPKFRMPLEAYSQEDESC